MMAVYTVSLIQRVHGLCCDSHVRDPLSFRPEWSDHTRSYEFIVTVSSNAKLGLSDKTFAFVHRSLKIINQKTSKSRSRLQHQLLLVLAAVFQGAIRQSMVLASSK